jgi:hypothetical protein
MPDVTDWLLQEDNPPVRYLALTRLLGAGPGSAEVRETGARLMEYGPTKRILSEADEFLGHDDEASYAKYTGLYWQAIFLGWFLADRKDDRVARLCDRLVERRSWVRAMGLHCLTSNLLAALTRMGYGDHPVVREEREALAARILRQEGLDCRAMDYSLLPRCFMAQPKALLCFAEVPPKKRPRSVRAAVDLLARRIVETEVFVYLPEHRKQWADVLARKPAKGDTAPGGTVGAWVAERKKEFLAKVGPGRREPKPGWLRLGFPLNYNSDVLEALYALTLAGAPADARLSRALDVVRSKRTPDGRWVMENSLNGKMRADVEAKGKPSKWLTFFALTVLRHFGG